MGTTRLTSTFLAALLFVVFAVPATAQDADEATKQYTLANLRAVRDLNCDALRRAKLAMRQADIHRSEAAHAPPGVKGSIEQRLRDSEAAASAAFEESGRLKRRLQRMTDAYVAARKLEWYQDVDQAVKIKLEEKIVVAREIITDGCS